MALVVKDYGNGSLGDVSSVTSTINSYARVTAVTSSTITINTSTQITGAADFTVGAKILLHVSATTSSSYKTYLGCWMLANITATSSGVLTLDADPTKCIPSANLAQYYVQAIAVAQYKNLELYSGTEITPPAYNVTNYNGGIVALMCSDTLTFGGGHINLSGKGIPVASKALRPTTQQENDGTDDGDHYSGWENSDTKDHLLLNAGDGVAFIVAKKMACNSSSRIGNTATRGYQFCRGATNSVTYNETKPSGVTNIGGSTIFIAAQTITNFTPYMISKYRSTSLGAGQGICRCYIASNTKLRNDEGLYAYDCISDKSRVMKQFGIKDFGNGKFGDVTYTDATFRPNNYAQVTAISGNKVTINTPTTFGTASIATGAMVMIHWCHKDATNITNAGRFFIANVLSYSSGVLVLDKAPPSISVTNYKCQVVSIPQYNNFTLESTIYGKVADQSETTGGIYAIAVKNVCNLSGGKMISGDYSSGNNKIATVAYGREGLAVIGNAQDNNKLPIGQGLGSVLILANHLVMNDETRIGYLGQGSALPKDAGGYRGMYTVQKSAITSPYLSEAGSGASEGVKSSYIGGYGSNGSNSFSRQGAHIMIIANKITNFKQGAISSGGCGWDTGGAGYGGTSLNTSPSSGGLYYSSGGYNGGSAGNFYCSGSSGWAFIYCNEVVNQDTTDTVLAN